MITIDLSGQWQLCDCTETYRAKATVPGCVHTDLLEANLIEDPYYRDNENKLQWISEQTWIYTRDFDVSTDIFDCQKIVLNCRGLDTFAAIKINGRKVAETDNMFREFFFDIKSFLKIGQNTIEITFKSVLPYIKRKQKERYLHSWMKFQGVGYVRKEPCNFGWDWGPRLITCGIWRPIHMVAYDTATIKDCFIRQDHLRRNVGLEIEVAVEKFRSKPVSVEAVVQFNNKTVASLEGSVRRNKAVLNVDIKNPRLWWPNGMGKQPLYHVYLRLKDERGHSVDQVVKRVGLRTLQLRQKKDSLGRSFEFVVNGKPFFAKGANWIPADSFAPRVTAQQYRDLLASAVDANMNMLRVWGGGIYEDDIFYDICDELGICVWQDFMFACSTYPTYDSDFVQSILCEAEDNIKRLRHHPSIALWCGNNELEMGLVKDQWSQTSMDWNDYGSLFDKRLPRLVSRHDPQRQYWPCSPHTPVGDRTIHNDPDSGDAHLWDVWHGMEPFEWFYQAHHRFVSEFGFQSFPEPATVARYTKPEDRNIASAVMDHHQRSLRGNARIMAYMLDWFKMPDGFENILWLSQILQAFCVKTAVEHFRRQMPRCMGTLYWQLNDCWPVASWSSIDYYGSYKALHWTAKRFYAPVLVSTVQLKNESVAVYLCNDSYQEKMIILDWQLFTTSGGCITSGRMRVKAASFQSRCVAKIDCSDAVKRYGRNQLVLRVKATAGKEALSENTHLFCPPKYLNVQKPSLKVKIRRVGKQCLRATISTNLPAFWTRLELQSHRVHYSDNFFDLFPGERKEIMIRCPDTINTNQLKANLSDLTSLYHS